MSACPLIIFFYCIIHFFATVFETRKICKIWQSNLSDLWYFQLIYITNYLLGRKRATNFRNQGKDMSSINLSLRFPDWTWFKINKQDRINPCFACRAIITPPLLFFLLLQINKPKQSFIFLSITQNAQTWNPYFYLF